MQIEHEKQMVQMQAAIPSKSPENPKTMTKKKPMRSTNEPKKLPDHEEKKRDSKQQPKTVVDKSETHKKRKKFGALVQVKEGLELDLKKNADKKKQNQMNEVGDRICRLVESERLKNVEIERLKDKNNGLVLKVEEEREKWMKVCCERDGIKANSDDELFEESRDLRKKMIELEKNEKRALEEIEDLEVKCKKLLGERMESEIMNRNRWKRRNLLRGYWMNLVGLLKILREKSIQL
ncbi:protein MNN4-like [Cucurbita maxima]|uniref:Protein MNN4-like n=1 Tax=Cucurbita maxima TaxID=3661 RepID=A0A6J1I2X9_CUCMA|nr:protein MNN4-like [Cucurbita maxima]